MEGAAGMKKVLFVLADISDFWNSRAGLARAAQARGWRVFVAAPGALNDQRLPHEGFTGIELAPFSVMNAAKIIFDLRKILKIHRPDLLHAVTLKYACLAGLAAGRKPDKKIYTVAGLGFLFSPQGAALKFFIAPFLKYALRNAQIIAQNPDDEKILLEEKFAEGRRCHVIKGSGVDLSLFYPRENPETGPPVVLMPTRLLRDKGIEVFIRAARIARRENIEARFIIAGASGGGSPGAISESEMKELCADAEVEWLGHVDDMASLYARCAIVVYPSYYREGVPRALLEACAMGKAIVTTDHPGCREAVAHGVNGLLVPVKNAEATADAIQALLQDAAKREAMGKMGRQLAERAFDVNLIVKKTLEIYEA